MKGTKGEREQGEGRQLAGREERRKPNLDTWTPGHLDTDHRPLQYQVTIFPFLA